MCCGNVNTVHIKRGNKMTTTKAKRDYEFVPTNYQELYDHYIAGNGSNSIARTLVRSFMTHGTDDEIETLVQDVFLRCLDKKVIEGYDPKKANFGGVIFFVVRSLCCNLLDRKDRDPLGGLYGGSLVTEDAEDGVFTPGTWNLDRFTAPARDVASTYEAEEQVAWLVEFTKSAKANPKNKRDESLYPLMLLLVEEYTPVECAEKLSVTTTTVTNWMKYLANVMTSRLSV